MGGKAGGLCCPSPPPRPQPYAWHNTHTTHPPLLPPFPPPPRNTHIHYHTTLTTQSAFSDLKWENLTAASRGAVAGFVDFDWGSEACAKTGGAAACAALGVAAETIFATVFEKPGDWDTAWDPDVHFVRSDDFFKSTKSKVQCGNQFELMGPSIYLAVSNKCPVNPDGSRRAGAADKGAALPGITLYTSTDGAARFEAACLPVQIKQEGYELLETHDGRGAVVIVDYLVRRAMTMMRVSSAYSAGPRHELFSLSLPNVYRQDATSAASDFMRVEGVPVRGGFFGVGAVEGAAAG